MHIGKYTEILSGSSGKNSSVIENHCVGYIKGEKGSSLVYNKKTGEIFDEIALYEQVVDENGNLLKEPLIGDNRDYYIKENGEEICLIDFFQKIWSSSNTKKEEGNGNK